MPQIPDFNSVGIETPQPYERPYVQPDESGQIIAGAAGELGRSVSQVGDVLERKANRDAATSASNALTNFQLQTQQALDQARKNAPDDAHGFTQAVLQDFDKRASDLLGTAGTNPRVQTYLAGAMPQLRAGLQENAMRWEAGQRTAFQTQSVIDNAGKWASLVQSDPSRQGAAAALLSGQIDALGLDPDKRVALRSRVASTLTMAAGQGAAQQDPLGTWNRLNDPSDTTYAGLNPEQRTGLQSYARAQLVDQQATGLTQVFANGGAQAGARALAALDQNEQLPADARDDVRQRVNALVSQLREDRRNQYAPQLAQLEQNIATGQAGPDDRAAAWGLYDKNALDPSQLMATLGSIYRSENKQASDAVALQAVTDAYTNKKPLDPKDPDVKDAVGTLFSRLTAGAQPGSPGYVNRAVDLATRTGVVPDAAVSWARANLVSGDPAAAAQSADLISRLEEANPRAVAFALGGDDKTRAMADTISDAVRAGTPAPVAVDIARKNASLPKAELDELNQQWQTLKVGARQAGALESLLKGEPQFREGLFSTLPDVPTAMQGDFDAATHRYFQYTGGNLDQARELAAHDVSRVWGLSEVNGKPEIMPYAPEAMFPGLTPDVVRQDITDTVQTSAQAIHRIDPGSGKLEASAPDADDVRLIPTDRTARTGGLEWSLGAPDQFGAMDVLRGADGNPLVYRLPVAGTDFNAVRARMAQAAIARARVHQQEGQIALDAERREFESAAEP